MKKDEFKLCSAFVIIALFSILACANTPYIVGKLKEIGKTATLEFWKDGTFNAVDNQKMAVKGKYTLIEPGNVKFEIFRQDSPSEIVNGTVSLQGDVLTFTSADSKEVERYKREKAIKKTQYHNSGKNCVYSKKAQVWKSTNFDAGLYDITGFLWAFISIDHRQRPI